MTFPSLPARFFLLGQLLGKINARCHCCIPEDVAAAKVCGKCSFVLKWSVLYVEKL